MKTILALLAAILVLATTLVVWVWTQPPSPPALPARTVSAHYQHFITLSSPNFGDPEPAIQAIDADWKPGHAVMLLESIRLVKDKAQQERLYDLLRKKTGQSFANDANLWFKWIWNQEEQTIPDYAKFKQELYATVDPSFEAYFRKTESALIRIDEVRWGSVARDGIPPLNQPAMLEVGEASYLNDTDIVFGVELNGDIRCYPKRILAWHEMFNDSIGGVPVCGVY